MQRTTAMLSLIAVAGLSFAASSTAHACACCAENGQRFERFIAFENDSDFAAEALRSVTLDTAATLYTDAADWGEVIRGLDNPDQSTDYRVALERGAKAWGFTMTDAKGNSGRIQIALPREFEVFAADPRPGDTKPGEPVVLYKEIRLTGVMTGTGMFEIAGDGVQRATLVLHGHGNGCTLAESFHHWTLTATGPDVRYSFYGKLQPAPQ